MLIGGASVASTQSTRIAFRFVKPKNEEMNENDAMERKKKKKEKESKLNETHGNI